MGYSPNQFLLRATGIAWWGRSAMDVVPLTYRADSYDVYVRECSADGIAEIDTFREPRVLDGAYA